MRTSRILDAFLALTLLVGACSDDDSDNSADATSTEVPAEVNQMLAAEPSTAAQPSQQRTHHRQHERHVLPGERSLNRG